MDKRIMSVIGIIVIAVLGGVFGLGGISDSNSQDTANSTYSNVSVVESGEYTSIINASAVGQFFNVFAVAFAEQ